VSTKIVAKVSNVNEKFKRRHPGDVEVTRIWKDVRVYLCITPNTMSSVCVQKILLRFCL
jgi:hypothetical protein